MKMILETNQGSFDKTYGRDMVMLQWQQTNTWDAHKTICNTSLLEHISQSLDVKPLALGHAWQIASTQKLLEERVSMSTGFLVIRRQFSAVGSVWREDNKAEICPLWYQVQDFRLENNVFIHYNDVYLYM